MTADILTKSSAEQKPPRDWGNKTEAGHTQASSARELICRWADVTAAKLAGDQRLESSKTNQSGLQNKSLTWFGLQECKCSPFNNSYVSCRGLEMCGRHRSKLSVMYCNTLILSINGEYGAKLEGKIPFLFLHSVLSSSKCIFIEQINRISRVDIFFSFWGFVMILKVVAIPSSGSTPV